jgi:hypothetical protein
LTEPPVASIDELVVRMQAIDAELAAADGLACFNRMYLAVTLAVRERIGASFFADGSFMTALDVVFANLYLDAVRASVDQPAAVPRSWAPLLRQRFAPKIAGVQFAVAGMNAHINHDLPVAVVQTCTQLGTSPSTPPHRDDYTRVDAVLADVEPAIQRSFEAGLLADADAHLGAIDNLLSNWSISEARKAAWTNAEVLWSLRRVAPVERAYLDTLDGTVGMASRGLLTPLL